MKKEIMFRFSAAIEVYESDRKMLDFVAKKAQHFCHAFGAFGSKGKVAANSVSANGTIVYHVQINAIFKGYYASCVSFRRALFSFAALYQLSLNIADEFVECAAEL